MRIAQVSPLFESVPPKLYGGTERIVSYLADTLVEMGHDVTLFASGDSLTQAELISPCSHALRLDPDCRDVMASHTLMFEMVKQEAQRFDLVHFHTDFWHFPMAEHLEIPFLTTLHGRLDLMEYLPLFSAFSSFPLVSVSHSQQGPLPMANWVGHVHHGLQVEDFSYQDGSGGYLAFLGRISPEKGVDRAIEMARRTGHKLKIAAKVGRDDIEYAKSIKDLLDQPHVEFVGEIGQSQKNEFLGAAKALLFPIAWPEPFGLVMIEALATGTPVVAFNNGSVPEVISHRTTGFVVNSVDEGCDAITSIDQISRRACREEFLRRFDRHRMVRDYVAIYESLITRTAGERPLPFHPLEYMAQERFN